MVFLSQEERALVFKRLHCPGNPLVLVNIWDAGSAKMVTERGAKALATSSCALAEACGYADGENIPVKDLARIVARIADTSNLPVSVDMEGGYGASCEALENSVAAVVTAGAVGINIEDGRRNGVRTLVSADIHGKRIKSARKAADRCRASLFINASIHTYLVRTGDYRETADETIRRAKAYRDAGADGIFVPGLSDPAVIQRLVDEIGLPINILLSPRTPSVDTLANLGVARISLGTAPFDFVRSAFGGAVSLFNRTKLAEAFTHHSLLYGYNGPSYRYQRSPDYALTPVGDEG